MTSITDAILARHSVRAFLDRPVSADLVRDLIDVARHAPSGGNLQPWKLIVVAGADLARLKAAVRSSLMRNPKARERSMRSIRISCRNLMTVGAGNAAKSFMHPSQSRATTSRAA